MKRVSYNLILSISLLLVLLLFTLLRTYNISQSLNFQNDIGRDYLYLIEWRNSGKPPLLGPQNSAAPFNQSAVYFYLFYPVFILSGMSFLTTFITNLIIHLAVIAAGFWALAKLGKKKLQLNLLLITLLAAVHPQMVIQHRLVWNPSLVFVSIAAAFFFFYLLNEKFTKNRLWGFAFSLAFAAAMNLSAAPALIAFFVLGLVVLRKHWLKMLGAVFVAGNSLFLPYWVFELRYNFQIIKRVMGRQVLTLNESLLDPMVKLRRLSQYLIGLQPNLNTWLLVGLFVFLMVGLVNRTKLLTKWGRYNSWLLLITLTFMFIMPIPVESHYIFAPLAFLLMALVGVKNKYLKALIISALVIIWIRPTQLQSYFKRAPRTYAQIERCIDRVCKQEDDPIFVSVQARHSYHTGPAFRYLMIKQGCDVKHIETEADQASKMAVINDQSEYTHGETAYDELTLFGESEEIEVIECEEGVSVHILEKILKE